MRPRGSFIGQLLIAFCVVAVLLAVAGAGGYVTAENQATAVKQLTTHYAVLQAADGELEANYLAAAFAVHNYVLTGNRAYLGPLAALRASFDRALGTLKRRATPGLRGLVAAQARSGSGWFGLVPEIVGVTPRTPAARLTLGRSAGLAHNFVAASITMQRRIHASVARLTGSTRHAFVVGLAWTGAALLVAVLLLLASSLSLLYTIARPLRSLAATVHRLTAGDYAARATVAGSAEVREVALSVNAQADEAGRLREHEAEGNRLRAVAREVGLRIREHLVAEEVLGAAQQGLHQKLDADVAYLRLLENGQFGRPIGGEPGLLLPGDVIQPHLTVAALAGLQDTFRVQASLVFQDLQGEDGERIPAEVREALRRAGAVSQVITPFGVGTELLGLIVVQRTRPGRPWTAAEVDAVESIAADLGRGLSQARLYQAENRLAADLRALDLVKSDFFATVSHELRAPLTTIEGYVEMLGDGEAGHITPQQRKMLETIDRSSVRLRNLIEDLFTLSKLESGMPRTATRPVNLGEIVANAVDGARPSVAAGDLTLAFTEPEEKLAVDGDVAHLDRVVASMLSNAVKFTPAGGHIEVTVSADDGSALVAVRDTGIGIPERDQGELFNRFFRASNATARRIPGTGLGLAIIRMIVNQHGGVIKLESREGAGTTVTVRLPLLETAE